MKSEIIQVLKEMETAKNIEILYACEAGSRVWGFSNDNSDYDIRFIYRNVNVGDYLTLKDKSDVIECSGDDIDIVGWDIRKALTLHYRSNPSLREWLISTQVYIDKGISAIFDNLGGFERGVLKNYYLNMAKDHWKRYCGLNHQNENAKKYLYVIRCILSWNLLDSGIEPPLSIRELLVHPSSRICDETQIAALDLINNVQSSSKISENTIFKLDNFIMKSFRSMDMAQAESCKDFEKYEKRFRELLLKNSSLKDCIFERCKYD